MITIWKDKTICTDVKTQVNVQNIRYCQVMWGRTVKAATEESPRALKALGTTIYFSFWVALRIDKLSEAAAAQGLENRDFS